MPKNPTSKHRRKIKSLLVLESDTAEDITAQLNAHVRDGWRPKGGVSTFNSHNFDGGPAHRLFSVLMVRYA